MNLLSLLLFFIALGVLVTIHEFGHFLTAKSFKVYCSDFSIGFGYKILKIGRQENVDRKSTLFFIKRKNPKAETTFSIGIVPLGGYVAMLGEEDNEMTADKPELKGRSIEDLSLWKKIIVFFAGIFMNFVLAWIIFFISASCFEQKSINYVNQMGFSETYTSLKTLTSDKEGNELLTFENPTDKSGGLGKAYYMPINYKSEDDKTIYTINNPTEPVKISGVDYDYALIFDTSNAGVNDLDYSKVLKIVKAEKDGDNYYPVYENKSFEAYNFEANKEYTIEPIKLTITYSEIFINENGQKESKKLSTVDAYLHLTINKETGQFNKLGFGTYIYTYWNGWNSFKVASEQWGKSTTLIGQTIAKLFYDANTWEQVGGPVAIFTQTTTILQNYPFYYYLNSWGMISVNLALFNLLPFPGLDGWSILVALIEGAVNVTKKTKNKVKSVKETKEESNYNKEVNIGEKGEEKVAPWKFPPKIKNIVSYIGLGLLFLLAIFIFIRDIIHLF